MSTLIVYATKHGCTEEMATELKKRLGNDAILLNIKKDTAPELSRFSDVIIGGSIHAGSIQKKIQSFSESNAATLLKKRLGLYLCCMYEGDRASEQFNQAYPEVLRKIAVAKGLFGGKFDFEKMNLFERAIVKRVANVSQSVARIDTEALENFAAKMTGM